MVPQVCVLPTSATSYLTRPPTGAACGVLTPGGDRSGFFWIQIQVSLDLDLDLVFLLLGSKLPYFYHGATGEALRMPRRRYQI